jgi:predicted acylesterase/phospholipase RssA
MPTATLISPPIDTPRPASAATVAVHDPAAQRARAALAAFAQAVFAGGGNRCWWQAGVWDVLHPAGLAPRAIAGVSAGAATACMLLAGRGTPALAHYLEVTTGLRRNFQPERWLRGERAFPHAAIYRAALLRLLDADALRRLRTQAPVYVQVARPPRWLPVPAALVVGALAYQFDKKVRRALHPEAARTLGFRAEVLRAQDCATPEALADLLLASSCTPPFTPALRLHGRAVLDGGMVDNVPVDALPTPAAPTLVLLTRRYPRPLPRADARVYLQPSRPIPVSSWDYTDAPGIRAALALGRDDASALLERLRRDGADAWLD